MDLIGDQVVLLKHENGIQLEENVARVFTKQVEHNPADLDGARQIAENAGNIYAGLFYQNKEAPRYDLYGAENLNMKPDEKISAIETALDRFTI